jgi:hypothetical protein
MTKYEISGIRRIRDYKIILEIISRYSHRQFKYRNQKDKGIFILEINISPSELEERLKESGLVFKILE